MPKIESGFKRIFFALPIDSGARTELASLSKELMQHFDDARWVPSDNLHITLNFIGEVEASEIPDILTATESIPSMYPAFSLRFDRLSFFGKPRFPRVLFLSAELERSLRGTLSDLAFLFRQATSRWVKPDDRPFTPHLTLARFKKLRRGDSPSAHNEKNLSEIRRLNRVGANRNTQDISGSIDKQIEKSPFHFEPVTARFASVVLYESIFGERGVSYREISGSPLSPE